MKSFYASQLGSKFAFINSMRRSFFVLSGPLNPLSGPLYQFGVGYRLNPNRGVKISKIFISSSYSLPTRNMIPHMIEHWYLSRIRKRRRNDNFRQKKHDKMKSVYAPELGSKFAFINSMRRSFFVLSGPLNPLSGPPYQFVVGYRLNPNRGGQNF